MREPARLARYVLRAAMYGESPYGTQPYGTEESLARIDRMALLSHREAYLHPARLKIVITGGIAPGRALALAEAMFGDWQRASAPGPLPDKAAGNPLAPRTIVVDLPGAGQAAVIAAVPAPSRVDADYFPLELANSVLGGGSSGRLFREIRTRRALSYGAYSGLADRVDGSLLTASAQTKDESAAEVARIILAEFERLGTEPLGEALLAKRRLYLTGRNARALETSEGVAAIITGLLEQGLPPAEARRYAERLAGVDAAAASLAARTYVDPADATLVIVGEASAFLEDLKTVRGEIEVIRSDEIDLDSPTLRKDVAEGAEPAP